VDVNFVGVQALGLEKKLVRGLVRKLDDLVLDRWAIAGANRLNLAAIHGRAVHVFADDAMRFRRSPRNVARHLRIMVCDPPSAKAEGGGIGIAGLNLEFGPVDGSAIEAGRGSGFETAASETQILERFAEKDRVRFS